MAVKVLPMLIKIYKRRFVRQVIKGTYTTNMNDEPTDVHPVRYVTIPDGKTVGTDRSLVRIISVQQDKSYDHRYDVYADITSSNTLTIYYRGIKSNRTDCNVTINYIIVEY